MEKLIKRLRDEYKGDIKIEKELLNFINHLIYLKYKKVVFPKCDIKDTVNTVSTILSKIDSNYQKQFLDMIIEDDCNKPNISIYNTRKENITENESMSFEHEIYFYKTNTKADIFLLMHEFTHFLMKQNNIIEINKESIPIFSEIICREFLDDYNFYYNRLNSTIFEAKSLKAKKDIIDGNTNLKLIYNTYNFTKEDIKKFEDDILYSKKLDYSGELKYIDGLLKALNYYSHSNSIISDYKNLIESKENKKSKV